MANSNRGGDGSPPTSTPITVKLGTKSCSIYVHPDDKIESKNLIRYKETPWEPWQKWRNAWVHGTVPLPILEKM